MNFNIFVRWCRCGRQKKIAVDLLPPFSKNSRKIGYKIFLSAVFFQKQWKKKLNFFENSRFLLTWKTLENDYFFLLFLGKQWKNKKKNTIFGKTGTYFFFVVFQIISGFFFCRSHLQDNDLSAVFRETVEKKN